MTLLQAFPVALRALWRRKMRSFLTTLGVIIGVASVISMVAVGEGAKASVRDVFERMGTNLLIVLSGSTRGGGVMGGFGSMPTLTWSDLEAIRSELPAIRAAAPLLSVRVTLQSDQANWTTALAGTTTDYFEIRAWNTTRGSLFSASDVESGAKVAVIGQTVADKLFGDTAAVGRSVRIKGVPFQVIGVLTRKGQSPMGQDYDDSTFVPATTFQAKIQGGLANYIPGVVLVSAKSAQETAAAQVQMEGLLRERHGLGEGEEDDFSVRNLAELAAAQQQGTKALTGLLAAIALVSLIVGGIGIMNIMLVSVTERTREVGLRMAVGAKPWQVLAQFLVESATLSTIGGLLGVVVGTVVARALASRLNWPFEVRPDIVLMAFATSIVVGVVFGIYPARKAARLDPIEALRYE